MSNETTLSGRLFVIFALIVGFVVASLIFFFGESSFAEAAFFVVIIGFMASSFITGYAVEHVDKPCVRWLVKFFCCIKVEKTDG